MVLLSNALKLQSQNQIENGITLKERSVDLFFIKQLIVARQIHTSPFQSNGIRLLNEAKLVKLVGEGEQTFISHSYSQSTAH